MIRGWDRNLIVSSEPATLAGGATFAAHWFPEPQPYSNQPVWLGFPHRAEQCPLAGSPFSSPGC